MAIIQCQIDRSQRDATIATRGNRTYSESYLIRTDNEFWGPAQVVLQAQDVPRTLADAPLPRLYDSYIEYNGGTPLFTETGIYCMEIQCRQADSVYKWNATATYRKLQNGESPDDDVQDPMDIPIKHSIDFADEYGTITQARNKEGLGTGAWARAPGTLGPIVDGAGQSFDEDIQDVTRRVFLVAEVPFATLQNILDYHRQFEGTYNDANWYGYGARQARYAGLVSSQELELNNIKYYLATIRVEVTSDDFDTKVPNRGWQYREAFNVAALTEWPGAAPLQLDYFGQARDDDDGTDFSITYERLNEADYSLLGI